MRSTIHGVSETIAGACFSRFKKLLADMRQDKGASRVRAQQLFPNAAAQFAMVKDDGKAEAVLLAEYGRRTQNGGQ